MEDIKVCVVLPKRVKNKIKITAFWTADFSIFFFLKNMYMFKFPYSMYSSYASTNINLCACVKKRNCTLTVTATMIKYRNSQLMTLTF